MRAISLVCYGVFLAYAAKSSDLSEGIADFNAGRYATALPRLRAAAASSNMNSASVYLALTQAALNNCTAALPTLKHTANLQPKDELPRLAGLAAAKCFSSLGQTSEALSTAEALKLRYPNDADVLYVAAETEMKAFNDTTFAMFQRTPSSFRVHELSARIFEVEDRFGDAAGELRTAIQLSPRSPDLHFRLGRAILLNSHSPEALQAAAEAFRAELVISPEDGACEFQLGQIAQVQGKTADAQAAFERALQLSPGFATAMVALARIYVQQRHFEPAISLLQQATKVQPDNEAAHYALLGAYRDSGQMEKALTEKAILDRLQKPPDGEFNDFLKRLGSKQPTQ